MKKLIKLYYVDADAINENGDIDPRAKLYPYFGKHYGVKKPDEVLNEPITYDSNYGNHIGRRVDLDIVHSPDYRDNVVLKLKPDKRGFSTLSYPNKEDRKDSLFFDWSPQSEFSPNERVDIHDHLKGRKDRHYTEPVHSVKLFNPDANSGLREAFVNTQQGFESSEDLSFADTHRMAELLDSWVDTYTSRKGDTFAAVPLIIQANDDDVVNAYDVLYNGYSPTRDFVNDTEVKAIRGREAPFKVWRSRNTYSGSKDELLKLSKKVAYMAKEYANERLSLQDAASELQLVYKDLKSYFGMNHGADYFLDEAYKSLQEDNIPEAFNTISGAINCLLSHNMSLYKSSEYDSESRWSDALKAKFNWHDDTVLSDAQYKQVIGDMYTDCRQNNIVTRLKECL